MGNMAKKTMALVWSLCMLVAMLPVNVLAYSFSESVGSLTVSYESEMVVPKGGSVNLSVQAQTTDGHEISYKWSKLKATGQTDQDGYMIYQVYKLDGATAATYTLQNVAENMSFQCEVWCDKNSYDAVYEDIYAADVLQLDVPVSCTKTGDNYQENYFVFTPAKSGTYVFSSSGSVEARLYVFGDVKIDSNNLISDYESNNEGSKKGGSAVAELSAGKSYAVQSYVGASETGNFSVSVQNYVETDFTLTSKQTSYNVDKQSDSTTMKVKASFAGNAEATDAITYQWYQYDPVEWDYIPISGANSASYTVQNSTLKWSENNFRCDATARDGESDTLYFELYHDSDWYAYSNDYDERVAYNSSATLNVQAGQTHDILDEHGEWIAEEFTENSKGKTYQWYVLDKKDSYYDGDKFIEIPNATSSEYTTGAVTGDQRYMCVVTDSSGICDYRQYYVRPILMNVSVDKTYYSVNPGDSLSLSVSADAVEKNTKFDYYWYKGTIGNSSGTGGGGMDYTALDKYQGKDTMRLTNITETQYLKCEVWAYANKSGNSVEDYVEINFVVNPGTGYFEMYTTSDDKNVKGASIMASSETTQNPDGSYTTVTNYPDGATSQTTTVEKSDGTVTATTITVKANGKETKTVVITAANGSVTNQVITSATNSAGKTVETTVTTKFNAKGEITSITEESVIGKVSASTSATITVNKDKSGSVTDASAAVQTASGDESSTITADLLAQIKEAAGKKVKSMDVTMKVTDNKGKTRYSVIFNTADITSGNELYLYQYDAKSDSCKAVSKKYTVSQKGNITVSASENDTYALAANEKDALKMIGQVQISDEETPLASGEDNSFVYRIILTLFVIAGICVVALLCLRRRRKK
jgi:hypothetical protein